MTHLYPRQGETISTIMEDRDGVGSRTNLIISTLKDATAEDKEIIKDDKAQTPNLLSLKGISLAGQPVDAVTVQATGQAAVRGATDLDSHIAHTLHHATGEAGASMGLDLLHPLSRYKEEREEEGEHGEHLCRCHKEDLKQLKLLPETK